MGFNSGFKGLIRIILLFHSTLHNLLLKQHHLTVKESIIVFAVNTTESADIRVKWLALNVFKTSERTISSSGTPLLVFLRPCGGSGG